MAAGERVHEGRGVVVAAQRERRELESRGPAFRPVVEGGRPVTELSSSPITRLRKVSASSTVKRRSATRSSSNSPRLRSRARRERRVGARGDRDARRLRQVIDEERHRLVDLERVDHVVVVECQHGLSGPPVEVVHEGREDRLGRAIERHLALPGRPQGARGSDAGHCRPRPATTTRHGRRSPSATRSEASSCRIRPAPRRGPAAGACRSATARSGAGGARADGERSGCGVSCSASPWPRGYLPGRVVVVGADVRACTIRRAGEQSGSSERAAGDRPRAPSHWTTARRCARRGSSAGRAPGTRHRHGGARAARGCCCDRSSPTSWARPRPTRGRKTRSSRCCASTARRRAMRMPRRRSPPCTRTAATSGGWRRSSWRSALSRCGRPPIWTSGPSMRRARRPASRRTSRIRPRRARSHLHRWRPSSSRASRRAGP